MVGPEGAVGVWLAEADSLLAAWSAVAKVGGEVLRLPARRFRPLLEQSPRLREFALEYALTEST